MTTVMLDKRDDGVALITLNRPERLNAFGEDLIPRLVESLEDCESDPDVRCVALTGGGARLFGGRGHQQHERRRRAADGSRRGQPDRAPQPGADIGDAARDGDADGGASERSGGGRGVWGWRWRRISGSRRIGRGL